MTALLVVDDDVSLSTALKINLRARGYVVTVAANGALALQQAARHRPDAIILDLGLPDIDGLEVLAGLRGWSNIPIVVLSARSTGWEKVRALDAGADDYVTKPFDMDELVARVRAAVRRGRVGASSQTPIVATGSFDVDLSSATVSRAGRKVRLTPTEWHLIEILSKHVGKLVTQQQLLSEVWGPGREDQTNYLRVYVAALRRKLEPDPSHPIHLITEPGLGYRLVCTTE